MRYVSATPAVYSRVKSKKDLLQAVREGFNAEVSVSDPFGLGYGVMGLNEIPEDIAVNVAGPGRKWFAVVTREGGVVKVDGKAAV